MQAAGILSRKVTRQQDAQKLGVSRRDAESINVQRETPKGQTEPLLGPFQATQICLYHRNPPYDRFSPPALSPTGLGQAPLPSPSQAPQPAILYPKPWAAGTTSGADTVNFQILIQGVTSNSYSNLQVTKNCHKHHLLPSSQQPCEVGMTNPLHKWGNGVSGRQCLV